MELSIAVGIFGVIIQLALFHMQHFLIGEMIKE